MAINFVQGQMLDSDLQRDSNLAFNTDLIYLDVSGNRVGIGTASPVSTLEVTGNITIGNILIPNIGNVSLANVNINNLADPVQNQDAATRKFVLDNIGNVGNIGNLSFSNTTVSTSLANGNITLLATGTEQVIIGGVLGFVVPIGGTGDRPNPAPTGTVRFNSDTGQLEVYDGTQWDVASGDTAVISNEQITPDGSTATYTLSQSTTANGVLVTMNGVMQTPGVDYTVSGNQLTFTTTPLITDIIQVRFISLTSTVTAITNASGNSSITVTNTPDINFEINNNVVASITSSAVVDIAGCHSLQLPSYDVANATALTNTAPGQVIYVTNGDSGNPCLAVYSGGAWKRISLGANIST